MITLGLDLGTNSIGWALVDERAKKIMATGVRVFPEGVDRDQQGGEKSKSAARRIARGTRRQISRRARRTRQLRQLLTDAGLLPKGHAELEDILELNPYELRRRALDHAVTPHELGRALLHLNQRRGFLSNRKTDKGREKETKGMLAEISALAAEIDSAGCRTLGEYLAKLGDGFEHTAEPMRQHIRLRHTRRSMYEDEFEALWSAQRAHHRDLLTEALHDAIHRTIFYQRKMYWPKSVVGRCELEPKQKRCPRADRAAQHFRLLQEVNNIRLTDTGERTERTLTGEERTLLIAYLSGGKERSFDQMRKKLSFGDHVRFNYERAERTKLKGHETDAALSSKRGLGKRWNELSSEIKDAIVSVLVDEEREDQALRRLGEECGLTTEEAQKALAPNLPDGYMSYSREAIGKLLPHLERGFLLMAEDESNSALHAAGYLRPDQREVRPRDCLPPAPDLPNPIVRQALVEVRKVVNALIREHGCPDRIHVELARDAKKSFQQRTEIRFENAKRRRRREEAAKRIQEYGEEPTRAKIDHYVLWAEQDGFCIYSARKITLAQLLSDAINVDHILPRWRSLDNSLANKVVCFREENEAKGDQTPREWLEDRDPDKYERVLRFADKLPYNKRRKFIQEDVVLDDFVARQLVDTAYISRLVTQYLRCLGAKIVTPRGQMTADLRHYWGLNTILDPKGRGPKNRADHRHHAIDAIVIALTDHKRLHALANDRGKDVSPPWESLRDDLARAVDGVNVSHRALRRLHGALHEETFYGLTNKPCTRDPDHLRPWARDWVEHAGAYVRRKRVTEIKNRKHLEKVRDGTIREILRQHLRDKCIDPDQSGNFPATAFKGENGPRMPSGVPINKVRMIEESETMRRVSSRRCFQYVLSKKNHHIVYRAVGEGESEKWGAEVVTMWKAARRARSGELMVDRSERNEARFVMSLAIGEAFQIDAPDGRRLLCVLRKMDQRSKRIDYKLHTDARPAGEINKDHLYLSPDRMRELNPRKVVVDPLGRIRRASD